YGIPARRKRFSAIRNYQITKSLHKLHKELCKTVQSVVPTQPKARAVVLFRRNFHTSCGEITPLSQGE
ncbi:MAG: hypothetical protein WBO71_10015, partial [Thermoanaerobaculia bacterium]